MVSRVFASSTVIVADLLLAVGGERGDLGDLLGALHLLGELGDGFDDGRGGLVDAALEGHRVRAGRDVLEALAVDGLGEQRGGGRAVAGDVVRLAGDFAHHLRAHVLEGIREFDLLRDGHAVLGDLRGAELLVEDHVAAGRTERARDRRAELLNAGEDLLTRLRVELDLLCHD